MQGCRQYIHNIKLCRERLRKIKRVFKSITRLILTIGQGVEEGCSTEAAVPGHGAHANLHFILRGPAEVRQHSLVLVALCVEALILSAPLLQQENRLSGTGRECYVGIPDTISVVLWLTDLN